MTLATTTTNNRQLISNKRILKEQGNILIDELKSIIVNPKNLKPDLLAIHIYIEARSWFKPKTNKYTEKDKVVYPSKLRGYGWRTSLDHFASEYKVSKELVRKKLVLLENLGLLKRDYRTECYSGQKYNNRLWLLVWKDTPYFYSEFGLEKPEKLKIIPPQNIGQVAKNSWYPIQQNVDIYNSNYNNNTNTEIDISDLDLQKSNFVEKKEEIAVAICDKAKNYSSLPKEKPLRQLKDWIPRINQPEADLINKAAGREYFGSLEPFNLNYIHQLMGKLSKEHKLFYRKDSVLKYLAIAIKQEKRQVFTANNDNFTFKYKDCSNKTSLDVTKMQENEEVLQPQVEILLSNEIPQSSLQIWPEVRKALVEQLGEALVISWFDKLEIEEDFTNQTIILKGSKFKINWLMNNGNNVTSLRRATEEFNWKYLWEEKNGNY